MKLPFSCLTVLSLSFAAAFAQAPSFEIADVHASPNSPNARLSGPFLSPGRYELHFATMVDLIEAAYGVPSEMVYGGPNWLEYDRFEIIAKVPAGSNAESRKLMLQALLADRFKLSIRKDSKPISGLKLTAKNPKLTESDGTGETGCTFKNESAPPPPPVPGAPQVINLPLLSYTCHNTTMAAFAAAIPGVPGAQAQQDSKPVADQTDLKGGWDFVIKYTPTLPINLPPGITIGGEQIPFPVAMEKQLGLKMETALVPTPILTVDSAQKPTPNSPEISKVFPPLPTEFEVAEIKPSAPVAAGSRDNNSQATVKNGRLIVPGITLKNLISLAWDLGNNNDDGLAGAPKWLDQDKFDLIAKAPEGVQIGDLSNPTSKNIPVNIVALQPMLRNLLISKFKLVVHTEQRPISGYTLVAVKPKMQQAEPNERTRWINGPVDDKDAKKNGPALGRLVTAHNLTMDQFAALLPQIASGYVHNEVLNSTGLSGGWDFTISFSPIGLLQGGGRGGDGPPPPSGSAAEASDPSGGLSLLDAMQKQIGLKLEMQKRPFPVLVIDHIEEKPADN